MAKSIHYNFSNAIVEGRPKAYGTSDYRGRSLASILSERGEKEYAVRSLSAKEIAELKSEYLPPLKAKEIQKIQAQKYLFKD